MVWLAIYPAITFLLWLAGPQIASWPLPLRTLLITAVLVPLMVFVLLPVHPPLARAVVKAARSCGRLLVPTALDNGRAPLASCSAPSCGGCSAVSPRPTFCGLRAG
jgi:hypothetical protein